MIKLSAVYVLAGLLFAGFAAFSAFDQANTKRLGNTAFWGLVSMSFLAGDRLGDLGNGLVVLALSGLAGFGRLGRGLATIVNLIDPDVIVLGGGMSNVDEIYDGLPLVIPQFIFSDTFNTAIRPAMHGDSSGVRGAAWLWPPP